MVQLVSVEDFGQTVLFVTLKRSVLKAAEKLTPDEMLDLADSLHLAIRTRRNEELAFTSEFDDDLEIIRRPIAASSHRSFE